MSESDAEKYKNGQSALGGMKKSKSPESFKDNLTLLKKSVLTLPFIFSAPKSPQEANVAARNRLLAVAGYEEAIKFYSTSAVDPDVADIEVTKHLKLLHPFYFDPILRQELKKSKTRIEIICLELLDCLVNQRFSEFYTLIEKLSVDEKKNDQVVFIQSIEENLMAGNYAQILKPKKGSSKLLTRLLQKLELTVQKEVQSCIESAYKSIPQKEAQNLLKLKKLPSKWKVDSKGLISFNAEGANGKSKIDQDDADAMIKDTLTFAKELERIV